MESGGQCPAAVVTAKASKWIYNPSRGSKISPFTAKEKLLYFQLPGWALRF